MSSPAQFVALTGGGAAFDPTTIAGLVAWYDFSDQSTLWQNTARTTPVTTDGQSILGVTDKSGTAHHMAQASAPAAPLFKTGIVNGRSVGRFDGTSQFMNASFTLNQPVTVVAIAEVTGNADQDAVVCGFTVNTGLVYRSSGGHRIFSGVALADGAFSVGWHIFAAIFNGASSKLWVDGGVQAAGDAGASNLAGVTLAANGPTTGFGGIDLPESLHYSAALSVAQINTLGNAMAVKYGKPWTTAT